MRALISLAEKQKIQIEEYDLGRELLGIYVRIRTVAPPVIVLHKSLPCSSPLTRCVMSEELGHHFTMVGDAIHKHMNYGNQIGVGKIEKAALRWAGKLLVSDEDLYKIIKREQPSIYELAQKFNVTEGFMETRLRIFNEEEYVLRRGTLYQRLQTTAYLAGSLSAF